MNLMCTQPGRAGVVNVEVGPGGSYDVLQLRPGADDWYFHANAYDRLPQPQKTDNSSVHRKVGMFGIWGGLGRGGELL